MVLSSIKAIKRISKLFLLLFCMINYAQNPKDFLEKRLADLGGQKIAELNFIERHYNGHKHWIEQSENFNGPFITSYEEVDEVYSLKEDKLSQTLKAKQFQFPKPIESKIIINNELGDMVFGETTYPIPKSYKDEIIGIINYDPYKLILMAKNSESLDLQTNINRDGDQFDVISFKEDGLETKLFFSTINGLLKKSEIETVLTYENFFSPFGNFKTTVNYSLYGLFEGGYRYPMQFDVYRLGKKWRSLTIDKIDFMKRTNKEVFTATRPGPNMSKVTNQKGNFKFVTEVEKNIYALKGQWYVHWVLDKNDIFIIESPISSSYSKSIIEHLKSNYPDKTIKGVIVASDAFPHVAGIRQYVASGISIYTHKNNQELLQTIISSKHLSNPDDLSKNDINPKFVFLEDKIKLTDMFSLYPVNGSGGANMLVVHDEDIQWLYTADLVQRLPDNTFFMPQYLSEVNGVVIKNNLAVKSISGMHLDKTDWGAVFKFLENVKK